MNTSVCQAPSCQLLLVSIPCPTWVHDPPTMGPRKHTCVILYRTYVGSFTFLFLVIHRKRTYLALFGYERSADNQLVDTAHIIPGSTVRTWLRLFAKLPAASYCLCRYHVPRGLTALHRWILGGKHLHNFMLYMCMSFTFISRSRMKFYRLSYCSYKSKRISRKRRSFVEYRYLSMDGLQIINEY